MCPESLCVLCGKKMTAGFWDTFFPRFCLGCRTPLARDEKIACPSCMEELGEFEPPYKLTPFYCALPLWEKKGTIESWLSLFLGGKSFLAEAFGALVVYRYCLLEIEPPDAVTYIPTQPYVEWSQGFCGKRRIAEACAEMFGVPCRKGLKWESDRLVSVGVKEKRVLVIETDSDEALAYGGIELEKQELIGAIIATSLDERDKTCPLRSRT